MKKQEEQERGAGASRGDVSLLPLTSDPGPRKKRGKPAPLGNQYAFQPGLPPPLVAQIRVRKAERARVEQYLHAHGTVPTESAIRAWVAQQAKAALDRLPPVVGETSWSAR